MAKVIDITDKLDFDTNPKIKVKGKEYEVNADAETVLKVMGLYGESGEIALSSVEKMYELLFTEKDRKELAKLKLKFKDFQTVVMAAVNLITGDEETEGE